nr:hypothetical protein [Streptococcus equi]
MTLGATLQAFLVPNEKQPKNIILGHDRPSDYLKNPLCAGQNHWPSSRSHKERKLSARAAKGLC